MLGKIKVLNKSVTIGDYELRLDAFFNKHGKFINFHIGGKPIEDKKFKINEEKLLGNIDTQNKEDIDKMIKEGLGVDFDPDNIKIEFPD